MIPVLLSERKSMSQPNEELLIQVCGGMAIALVIVVFFGTLMVGIPPEMEELNRFNTAPLCSNCGR